METMAQRWTEKRISDLRERVDREFTRVNSDIRDLREEMRSAVNELRREMIDIRYERRTGRGA